MSAQLIDGVALSRQIRAEVGARAAALAARGRPPGLAVILVGDDPASAVYVRNKVKACHEHGLHSVLEQYDATLAEATLLARIAALNADPAIHGVLVQMPLPQHIDPQKVIAAIAPQKDVDGFRAENVGALMQGQPCFIPCTPYGAMKFLESAGIAVKGKEAVVVGRSNIVGKPMAMLLMHAGATVTVCHSQTKDLKAHCLRADILVAAIGRPKMITGDMVKPGAVVIDVGINRQADGKLCGDVDFESAKEVASYITPVPGGVGPMTITMLLANTLQAAEGATP